MAPAGEGRRCVLGGIDVPSERGPVGHSDGDAVFHAVTDALLGALCEPDIGQLFPDTDPSHDGADSRHFLEAAMERVGAQGYVVGNMDITVICELPKIGPHKDAMRSSIAQSVGCDVDQVNVKGKTHEGVDATGEGRAIQVHAVVLLVSPQSS